MTPVEPIAPPKVEDFEATPKEFRANNSPLESWDDLKSWMGEEMYDKYTSLIINSLRNEMARIEKKAKKAARNLKNAIEGNPQDP